MLIDIVCAVLLLWALFKGWRNGLVVGVFSFLALVIGLAAALKLSAWAADYLGEHTNIGERWLPFLAFTLVFIVVVLLIRLGAKLIETAMQVAMLGWFNRLGGILFYSLIHLFVFSIILFYADQLHIIKEESQQASVTYPFLKPIGPKVINALGYIIPAFKNMFTELEQFFSTVATKANK
jgi:membrane protein required for colicin V production